MRRFMMLFAAVILTLTAVIAQVGVSGVVVSSADGLPIVGASVLVKGSSVGTITDIDGKFSLRAPSFDATLVVSYIGMKSTEVKVASKLTVVLTEDSKLVDEVVVTALGISRSEKSIGYAATNVTAEQLTQSKSSDVVSALAGKVAGVQVSSASDPGSSNSIIIRGITSIGGSNQPLFVVDGVPMANNATTSVDANPLDAGYDFGNAANLVNPSDVESMTILKGAAATALYGSRAANGVVMITTKSGKGTDSKLAIDFNVTAQMSDILRLPEFQNDFGMGWDGLHTLNENGSWGPRFDGVPRVFGTIYNGSQQMKPYVALPNNIRDFFETGSKFQSDLALYGTSGKASYYASFSTVNDNGMLPSDVDTYSKYTIALRGSYDFKYVKISSAINWADQSNHFATSGQGLTMINSLYQTPRDISIVDLKDLNNPFNSIDYYYTPYGVTNPYVVIKEGSNKFNQNKTYGKVQVDINPIEKLSIVYRFGFDYSNSIHKIMVPQLIAKENTPNYQKITEPGSIGSTFSTGYELNHDVLATYTDKWSDFDFGLTVGTNINERGTSKMSSTVNTLSIPGFNNLSNSSETPIISESQSKRRLIGLFGDLQLGWKSMLFLNLTARNDWSSTLPLNSNSFFYPGATLSWVFTELMKDHADILSFGKIRVAYGMTGNDADVYMTKPYYVPAYASNEYMQNDQRGLVFPFNGLNAYRIGGTLSSGTLTPEITSEYEVGLSLNLFRGRIEVDAAYYNRVSDRQIFSLGVDPASGYSFMNTNLGQIANQGVEVLLNTIPVKTREFTWTLGVNFTKNYNKVLSLPKELGGEIVVGGFSGFSLMARQGHPMGEFKMTQPMRTESGQVIVNPTTGLPIENPELQYAGNVNHDFEMGVNTSLNYKGFTLSASFDWRQGGQMYSRTKDINYFTGNAKQTTYNGRNPFIIPNSVVELPDGSYAENTTAISVANMDEYFDGGGALLDESWLIDRSYIKLRSLVLSYDLPKAWVSRIKLQGVKLSAFGNNLFVWTPADNSFIDPEMTSFGNDFESRFGEFSANPTSRNMGLSLNVKF